MPGPFLGTKSWSARLAVVVSFLGIFTLLILAALAPASNAALQGPQSEVSRKQRRPEFVPGEALVRYRSQGAANRRTQQKQQAMLSEDGRQLSVTIERFEGLEIVPGLRLARVAPEDTMAAIEALKKQPDVLYAEPNYLLYPDLNPNDPRFTSGDLFGLTKIGAPTAWNTTTGSNSVVVGVTDEGIDKNHPDLQSNIWINPGDTTVDGVDNDLNGFIDDVNGYNFASNTGTIPAENHATHVAGTIGAVGDNGTGVVGVNWQVRLMSLRFIDGSVGSTADAIRASNYARQMRELWISSGGTLGANVRILNNSYGGGSFTQSFLDAINGLNQSGILFVASAGNADNSPELDNEIVPHYPGSYDAPNVIAVAATDSNDALASFSHFGLTNVQLGAPGVGILSTTTSNTYSFFNGTSMATPHVVGAAALLLAQNPNLTVQQLKSLLIFNGDSVPSLAGKTLTGRRLNVAGSFAALAENDTSLPGTPTNFIINSQNGRALNVGWTSSGDDDAAGQASLYKLSFTDATTGALIPLKSVIPGASGVPQAIDVKLPYRHTSGTLTLREFDNVGNEGTPATVAVSVSLVEGDPYLTSLGNAAPLSTGGTPLALIGDDKLKLDFKLPFQFPFFGQSFSTVNISTNGNLFFSAPPTRSNGDADDVPSSTIGIAKFKMISGLWDDLRTDRRAGDDVFVVVNPDANRIIFRWQGVTFGDGTPATEFPFNFEIELRSNGTILTRYGAGQSAPSNTNLLPVVGISAGEPEAYVIPSHTSEQVAISLTNAPEVTFLPRANSVLSSVQFSAPQFEVTESGASATVTVNRTGDISTQATVGFATIDGGATQKGDYTIAVGRLTFAAGEASKSFPVLIVDDAFPEGTETFSVSLTNPIGTIIGAQNVAAVAISDNDSPPPATNPLDNADAAFFVRQHYLDFLNREPDAGGLAFWRGEIVACDGVPLPIGFTDAQQCREIRRINVSAAFFLSIEFQETGYLVYRTYKSAFSDPDGQARINGVTTVIKVPRVSYIELLKDTRQLGANVQVGIGNWQQQLEDNKQAYMLAFVQRADFQSAFPASLTADAFVTRLDTNAGGVLSASEKASLVAVLAANPNDVAKRAQVLRGIAEDDDLKTLEKNRAFVLMQYFGYLRRNPNDVPDADHSGWKFWWDKLNAFGGNFVEAQMVKAFIDSIEYRQRFAP